MLPALLLLPVSAPLTAQPTTVLHLNFDEPAEGVKWTAASGSLTTGFNDTQSLAIRNAEANRSVTSQLPVPVDSLKGKLITLSAVVRADGVSQPPNPWNGIKVMLVLETEHGKQHPQLALGVGSYDWTPASRAFRVPLAVTKATLVLGLEQVTGTAWFDEISIRVGRPARAGARLKVKFTGHGLPRLRGVMHGPKFDEENLRHLATEWRANQVRWQLNWVPMKQAEEWATDLAAYDKWLEGVLTDTDKALDLCEELGLLVLVDLHCPPGGRSKGGVCRMFTEQRYQDKLLSAWDRIARRYRGRQCVYAYDLVNEPVEPARGGTVTWRDLATKVIDTIRAVDPDQPVVYEPGPWGGPEGFDQLTPLDRDRVIYSFHMYKPHQFTHQGVHGAEVGVSYPGVIAGERWDKERLREAMVAALDFQREFNVQMYVGEFSAIRWAPDNSAYRYLRDCIDLFEEYGWDWSYHAYREWPGWSVEHGPDPDDWQPAPEPTDRLKLLLGWFAKNQRPTWR